MRSPAPGRRPGCDHSGPSAGGHVGFPWRAAQRIRSAACALLSPEAVALKGSAPRPATSLHSWPRPSTLGLCVGPSPDAVLPGGGEREPWRGSLRADLGIGAFRPSPASPSRQPQAQTPAAAFCRLGSLSKEMTPASVWGPWPLASVPSSREMARAELPLLWFGLWLTPVQQAVRG